MTVTREQIIDTFHEVVAENPDFIYPQHRGGVGADDYHDMFGQCQYKTPTGAPACVWGHVINRLDPEAVPRYGESMGIAEVLVDFLGFNGEGNPDVILAAEAAQEAQDEGLPWREAGRRFDSRLGLGS